MKTSDDQKRRERKATQWELERPQRQAALRQVQEAELSQLRQEQKAALWQLRQVFDLSQEQLAQLLGISSKSIFRYEKGSDPIPFAVAYKLRALANQKGLRPSSIFWDQVMEVQSRANVTDASWVWSAKKIKSLRQISEELIPEQPVTPSSGENTDTRTAELVRTLIEMWNVYQPQMNAAEERIHDRIDGLLKELARELRLEDIIVQPKPHGRPTKEKKRS